MNKNDILITVTDLARGGAGVSRESSGRVLFIPFTAPGDVVKVALVESEKRYAQAELIEIIKPSPVRQEPRCPAFQLCGGCQWQHLPYSLQWETKKKGVIHALSRVQIQPQTPVEELKADQIWEYRNRIQLRGEGNQIGFFKPGSRQLVPVSRCDIARKEINQIWKEIQSEGEKFKHPYKVEIEVLPSGKIRKTWNSRHSASGFRQVHDEQNERMREWVFQQFDSGNVLYDLFGGSGNLCLLLAPKIQEIHCVDLGAPKNPPASTPAQVHFHRDLVVPWISNYVRNLDANSQSKIKAQSAYAILDPPREGLVDSIKEIASALDALNVRKIVTVGCDPDAWARDLSRWMKRGWTLEKIALVDLFPQTIHIESIAVLSK